ncbi:MAG: shikimate dehydrogenase [Rhodobacteraceae bacterium]|nr:shikimate dehydrogenase [Paracoccaceae bacterium]
MIDKDRFYMAGVMGWPVMHSRSPLMHNYWFRQQGLKGTYVPLAIKPGAVEAALRALHPLGFSGCNLTIPHKLDAMQVVDELDDVARKIGAISCAVVREDGALFGTNNDWRGFLGNLKNGAPDWCGNAGPAVVLGAGGGSRAICHALLHEGCPEIRLVNRTRDRAERIAADFGGPINVVPWEGRHDALEGAATVVNTTSLGMVGQPPLDLKLDKLARETVAADIIYTPLKTDFLKAAEARGNTVVGGLGMLLYQGPPAWKLWFGLEPTVTDDLRQAMEASILGKT